MSVDLVIYKNNTFICDRCGGNAFVQAFTNIDIPEDKTEFDPLKMLPKGVERLNELIEEAKDCMDTYNRALMYSSEISLDEKLEVIDIIKEQEELIQEYRRAQTEIEFLIDSATDEGYMYDDQENKLEKAVWYWYRSY